MADKQPLLHLRSIAKEFPGTKALKGVDFSLYAGEVHALIGENGAGKSTLIKIIAGLYQPDDGAIELEGMQVEFHSPGGFVGAPYQSGLSGTGFGARSQHCGECIPR